MIVGIVFFLLSKHVETINVMEKRIGIIYNNDYGTILAECIVST